MIRHIVFFKLKDNSKANKQRIKDVILPLKEKIDVIKFYQVGINFSNEERAYDLALVSDFDSIEDLKSYAAHPEHLEVISQLKNEGVTTKVVDFEYQPIA